MIIIITSCIILYSKTIKRHYVALVYLSLLLAVYLSTYFEGFLFGKLKQLETISRY